jgi:hypothetical protein
LPFTGVARRKDLPSSAAKEELERVVRVFALAPKGMLEKARLRGGDQQ